VEQLPQDPAPPAVPDIALVPEAVAYGVTYKDRSTGLTIFGIIEMILGALAALMAPVMLLGAAFSRKIAGGAMPAGTYVSGICSYTFAAAVLVTLGIGAIRARRWSWALNLILSWYWLIVGVVATVAITVFMPRIFAAGFQQAAAQTPNAPPLPTGVFAVILTLVIVFMSFFLVILPLAFLLFYGRKDVEETCKRRDPEERWTDRCPLPVLAVSLLLGSSAVYFLLMAVTTPFIAFFGRYLTGLPAAAVLVVMAGIDCFLAVLLYRVSLAGWWLAVSALVLRVISVILTFRRADLMEAYSKMGLSDTQLQQMSANPAFRSGTLMLWWSVVLMILFLGYMIWIKRFFRGPAESGPVKPEMSYQPSSAGPAL
jgi:uncharacterized membrane protein